MLKESEFIKLAYKAGYRAGICKSASPLVDLSGGVASSIPLNFLVPGSGRMVNGFAGLAGRFDPANEAENFEYDSKPYHSFIPGVGSYRLGRRIAGASGKHKLSNYLGNYTSSALSTALGAGIGALVGKKDRIGGALGGAAIGAGANVLAHVIAGITALAKKRRGDNEQQKYKNSDTAAEWLVPGVAGYNTYKTLGYLEGKSREHARELAKENEKKKKERQKDDSDDSEN